MNATELVIGARYILDIPGHPVGVYDGRHSGLIVDGDVEFYGADNQHRFVVEDATGGRRLVLLGSGREVEELEETKLERERVQRERKEQQEAAERTVLEYLGGFGIDVCAADDSWDRKRHAVYPKQKSADAKDARSAELENFTFGHLVDIVDAVLARHESPYWATRGPGRLVIRRPNEEDEEQ